MTAQEKKEIAEDYLDWSGGFPPTDDETVRTYVVYALSSKYEGREEEIQEWLSDNVNNEKFGRENADLL
jgi:hypothetical protein